MASITDSLTGEHGLLCELFEEIGRLLPDLRTVAEVRLLSRLVEGVISRHADVEQNLAFAALNHALAEKSQMDRLHLDHREIDESLRRATIAKEFTGAVRLLKAGLAASRDHFLWEEQTLFPLFEKLFDAADLEALGIGVSRKALPRGPSSSANARREGLQKSTGQLRRKRG